MKINLSVEPTGKATAYTVLTQGQVDSIRGTPGRGRVNIVLRYKEYEFRTSVSIYRGEWMFVVNKAMREAGLLPGKSYRAEVTRDDKPKVAEPARDVLAALRRTRGAKKAWEALTTSCKRQHLKHIEAAKRPETRQSRIARLIDTL
jgi:hypothetical protein